MATQEVGADGGYKKIVIGGPMELLPHFVDIKQVKNGVTVYPGRLVSGNGEIAGIVDLAAAGDGAVADVWLVLDESPFPSSYPTDGTHIIDQGILGVTTTGPSVRCLRPSKLFKVVMIYADQSADTVIGQPLALEADGMVQPMAALYTDATYATDTLVDMVARCANVVVDVAGTDLVIEAWF